MHWLSRLSGLYSPELVLAVSWFEWLEPFFESYSYFSVFFILLLCGVGLPIPEEMTFIVAGYIVKKISLDVWIMILVSVLGIVAGDSITYFLGRRYGYALLTRWPFNKLISQKGLERSKDFFSRHGPKTIFICGCLAGVRAPTFFLSGSMGLSYGRFLLWDLARALVTCPISILAGYWFGEEAEAVIAQYKYGFLGFLGVLVLAFLIHWWLKRPKSTKS